MTTIIIKPAKDRYKKIAAYVADGFRFFKSNENLIVGAFPNEEKPRMCQVGASSIISLGSDIRECEILSTSSVDQIKQIFSDPTSLNGTFTHIEVKPSSVTVISDRFGSISLFYAVSASGELILSTGYRSLLKQLTGNEAGKLCEEVVYEFLYMRRLFGEKTYHDNIARLPSACRMKFDLESKKIKYGLYWRPSVFQLSDYEEATVLLAEGIRGSTEMYLSDSEKRYGLMLSGGLDSRALLSIGRNRYISFTTATTRNNEVRIASELANLSGSEHRYLPRPKDYFADIFQEAITCSNAMTVFYESQFIGYLDEIAEVVDVVHVGLGLDIFFCGHYLPKYHPNLLGRPSLHFKAQKVSKGDEEKNFIDNITYRLKSSSLLDIINQNSRDPLRESLMSSIHEKMEDGRSLGLSTYNLWEYMHLTDLGRHYSMLMAHSLKGKLDVQIPALENKLYDLAFMISPEMKLNWTVYRKALARNSAKAMAIRNSNTNFPPSYGLLSQTLFNIVRGGVRKLAPRHIQGMPNYRERSWPLVRDDLDNQFMREKIETMVMDGKINDLSFVNPGEIKKIFSQHKYRQHDHAVLLGLLLTIEYGLLR